MGKNAPSGRRWMQKTLTGMALPAMLASGAARAEDAAPSQLPAAVVAVAPATPNPASAYTLGDCIRIGREQQPGLVAQRASLAAAQTASASLNHLHVPSLIARDLPIRRHQACLGITIAEAGLQQAEYDTIYAITRTYYGVLYAREQLKVAEDLSKSLKFYQDNVRELVKNGTNRQYTTNTLDKITLYLKLAEARQAEAARGIDRATAALNEAMGLDPQTPTILAETTLPNPKTEVTRDQIVMLALARRGELVQATTAREVVDLEADAQDKLLFRPTTHTFAAGADVHSRPVPQGFMNGEYRPGATSLEMPVMFAGSRSYRVERARDLGVRAGAVVDKTRNLITLEAEDAFFKYEEAVRKLPLVTEASTAGARLSKTTRDDFTANSKATIDDILTSEGLAAQAKATANETIYNLIVSLAGLQRVTGGGFVPVLITGSN
ncbi:MAG TPA: TolC family protein [Gemmataceae bacterium]|nr:TolC family protein [Gemmataceae bacterium]